MKLSVAVFAAFVASAASFTPSSSQQQHRMATTLFGRKAFITGNWKLNPATKDEAVSLATTIADSVTSKSPGDVALFVPFPYLESVHQAVKGKVTIGAEVRSYFEIDQTIIMNSYLIYLSRSVSLLKTVELLPEVYLHQCLNLWVSNGLWQVIPNVELLTEKLMKISTNNALNSSKMV
jgi:Triosephosphate isomerase